MRNQELIMRGNPFLLNCKKNISFLASLLVCLSIYFAFPENAHSSIKLAKTWSGTYYCGQGQGITAATVVLDLNSKGIGSATFSFGRAKGGKRVPNGSFKTTAKYDPVTRKLQLRPTRWIRRPANIDMVGVNGLFDKSHRTFSGTIEHRACNNLNLKQVNNGQFVSINSTANSSTQRAVSDADIQRRLQQLGFNIGTIDGKLGRKTRNAIKAFQRANGLTADGKIGNKTLKKLFATSSDGNNSSHKTTFSALDTNQTYWGGTVTERSNSYGLVVKFNGKQAVAFYERLNCHATWNLQSKNQNQFVFREQIEKTNGRCVNNGTIEIEQLGNNELAYNWKRRSGSRVAAKGTLRRKRGVHHRLKNKTNSNNIAQLSTNTNRQQGHSKKELWNKNGIKVARDETSASCAPNMVLSALSSDIAHFDDEINKLQTSINSAVKTLLFTCPSVASVQINGQVSGVKVFEGSASKQNRWTISSAPSPLELEAKKLASTIKTFDDVNKINRTLSPYKQIKDFENTFQHFIFTDTAKKIVSGLLQRDGGKSFENLIDQTYAKQKSAAKLRWEMRKVIHDIAGVLPNKKQELEGRFSKKSADIIRADWTNFASTQLSSDDSLTTILTRLKEKAEILPPEQSHGIEIDSKVAEWLKDKIRTVDTIENDDYQKVVSKKQILISSLKNSELSIPFLKSQAFLSSSIERIEMEALEIEWNGFLDAELEDGDIFENTVSYIAQKTTKLELHTSLANSLDNKLKSWLAEEIEIYESLTDGGYLADISEREKLADVLGKTNLPKFFGESQSLMKASLDRLRIENKKKLSELLEVALEIISNTGDDYTGVSEVVDEAIELASSFEENGFDEQAKTVLEESSKRVDTLINEGHESLKSELQSAKMNRETIEAYQEQANIFGELSQQFDGFDQYVSAIETGIQAGRKTECQFHAESAFGSKPDNTIKIDTETGALNLSDLACALYANDHILRKYDAGWLWQSATLSIDNAEGALDTFKLDKQPDNEALFGVARIDGETETEFGIDQWRDYIAALTITPPSGKPNSQGITECDLLTADPNDPNKVSDGINFEDQTADYDFDRAIDACIAAVEVTPDQPRYHYQLARVLNFAGVAEEAKSYVTIASEAKYAAALHLNAEMQMFEEGFNDFDRVNEIFKQALKLGYKPSSGFIFDDSAVIFDENGIAKISCSTEQHILNARKETEFSLFPDITFKIDSNKNTIIPSYNEIAAYNNVGALSDGRSYKYTIDKDGDIQFRANPVSRGYGDMFINPKTGELSHRQGLHLGSLFGHDLWGAYRIFGSCFSEISEN